MPSLAYLSLNAVQRRGTLAFSLVEVVVGRVTHQRLLADVFCRATARRRCDPSRGVQPLDEGGRRERVATGWPVLGSNHLQQEPGNCTWGDKGGVGGRRGRRRHGPDGARVP